MTAQDFIALIEGKKREIQTGCGDPAERHLSHCLSALGEKDKEVAYTVLSLIVPLLQGSQEEFVALLLELLGAGARIDRPQGSRDEANLTAQGQTPLQAFLSELQDMAADKLEGCLQCLLFWRQAPLARRAIVLKLLDSGLPNKRIAQLCGVTARHLRRCREYQEFARFFRQPQQRRLPRGHKGAEGDLEAWDPD